MPKVTEEYIRNKKSKIVEAAYNLCLRKTVSAVTMQDIINEAGLSQGGIYRFYRDIDEIFADMVRFMRQKVDLKVKVDAILMQKEVSPGEIVEQLFAMLAVFMRNELMGIEKIDFELSVLSMNAPERTERILKDIPDMGNMEYLNMRTSEYFMEQLRLGRIHPRVSCEELLSFISCAYVGIQMTCIVHNCYKEETDSRTPFYQPDIQLKMLAQTVNYMLGEA